MIISIYYDHLQNIITLHLLHLDRKYFNFYEKTIGSNTNVIILFFNNDLCFIWEISPRIIHNHLPHLHLDVYRNLQTLPDLTSKLNLIHYFKLSSISLNFHLTSQ